MFDDARSERFRIVELVTEQRRHRRRSIHGGEGAVGAVIKRGMTMNLEHVKPGYRGLCYYRGPPRVRAFLGVPVIENGQACSARCARTGWTIVPFGARDEASLEGAVQHTCCAPSRTSACSCSSSAPRASRPCCTRRRRRWARR